jgi:hypothetical protein
MPAKISIPEKSQSYFIECADKIQNMRAAFPMLVASLI